MYYNATVKLEIPTNISKDIRFRDILKFYTLFCGSVEQSWFYGLYVVKGAEFSLTFDIGNNFH